MPQTKYDVASAALVMVGASPVTSFGGHAGTAISNSEQIACTHLYDPTVRDLLESHPWRFASRTSQLSRLAEKPDTKWRAKYKAPSDALSIEAIHLGDIGNSTPFDRYEDEIMCNADESETVWCTHTFYPTEHLWPSYFTKLVHLELASIFAVTLAAKIDLSEALGNKAQTQLRMAKSVDSKQQTTKKLRTQGRGSIIQARRY